MLKSVVKVLDAKPVGPELSSWLCCRHFLVIVMGLEKAIQHGKEHRKPFGKGYGNYSKSIDMSCRNHGGCPWCEGNRTYKYRKRSEGARILYHEYNDS